MSLWHESAAKGLLAHECVKPEEKAVSRVLLGMGTRCRYEGVRFGFAQTEFAKLQLALLDRHRTLETHHGSGVYA